MLERRSEQQAYPREGGLLAADAAGADKSLAIAAEAELDARAALGKAEATRRVVNRARNIHPVFRVNAVEIHHIAEEETPLRGDVELQQECQPVRTGFIRQFPVIRLHMVRIEVLQLRTQRIAGIELVGNIAHYNIGGQRFTTRAVIGAPFLT